MKILRITRKGVYELYVILNGEVYRLVEMDPLKVLERYLEGRLGRLGEKAELDLGGVLRSRDPEYKVAKPIDPPEVWGAGITYQAARASYTGGEIASIRGRSVYELVYESDRPELFLKDAGGRRCVAHQDPIVVRSDSRWTLPEPELAVILGSGGKILGYTIANDVTARDIEAENPLYLPQAKTYDGCCSFGPYIVTPDEIKDPYSLKIEMRILRRGKTIFEGKASTSMMRKKIDHILRYLLRDNTIPPGTLLMTGTAIVPGKDISLEEGDEVEISIEGIGTLLNPVIRGRGS
ncbi:MAG: fumarylacetoacetate hydrolase family protein [Sulfolobales archaeon]